ncbi:MAG: GAF and ANTAR domain-containing protein [Actinobacteria bacterium]|nr:GAF and ANTAR domain-containing protein [Actinomycetota bacterium]
MTTQTGAGPIEEPDDSVGIELASWSVLEQLGRALRVPEADLQATLDAIARTAVQTISAAKYAGVNLYDHGKFVPQSVAGEPPLVLDVLQQATGIGPCIDAAREQATIRVDDMTTETRWPEYVEQALALGVASMLCVPMYVEDQRLGSVSLYATDRAAFSLADEYVARLLAAQAAMALAEAHRAGQLRQALSSRDVIGQAKGILMERHRITADEAFRMLSEHSQRANRKLADVARTLAETGTLS